MLWRPFIERKCNVRCVRNTRWHVDGWRALKSLQLAAIKKPLQESHGICSKIFRLNCFASHSQHFPPLRSFRQSSESVDTGRSDLQRYNTAVDRVPASQTSTNLPSVTLLYIYIYILQLVCNVSDAKTYCNITAAVILPEDDSYEMSLSKVLPVLETARQYVIDQNWLPSNVNLMFLPLDDRCSNVYSIFKAQYAYSTCAHVFFGPSCEYALGEYIFTLLPVFSVSQQLASLLGNHRMINVHRCLVAEGHLMYKRPPCGAATTDNLKLFNGNMLV